MNYLVKFHRNTFIVHVKKLQKIPVEGDVPGYFETQYQLDLYEEGRLICTTYFNGQYDETPDQIDIATAISDYFNHFCLYFSRYASEN